MPKRVSNRINSFYCINCGNKAIDLPRKTNKLHNKFHRKRMYCPWCKTVLNHVEIRNDEEKNEFIEKFQNGEFKEEAKKSIEFCNKDVFL